MQISDKAAHYPYIAWIHKLESQHGDTDHPPKNSYCSIPTQSPSVLYLLYQLHLLQRTAPFRSPSSSSCHTFTFARGTAICVHYLSIFTLHCTHGTSSTPSLLRRPHTPANITPICSLLKAILTVLPAHLTSSTVRGLS